MRVERRLDPVALFEPEIGIAEFIGLRACMAAIGEQFLRRRRAFGVRQVEPDTDRIADAIASPDRSRDRVEMAVAAEEACVGRTGAGSKIGAFEARARLRMTNRAGFILL